MSRTEDEIQKSIEASIESIDPTIQTKHGPVRDMLIKPVPAELASLEADTERLQNIYKLEFLETSGTAAEIEAYQTNFGLEIGSGRKATGTQVFFRNEAPSAGELITVPIGTLVGNLDKSSTFKTIETVTMDGDFATNFFNPVSRRYEVLAKAEALNIGVGNNLPSGRVTELVTALTGIIGTTNDVAYSRGEDRDTQAIQFNRIQDRFKGLDSGTPNGINTQVREFDTSLITDSRTVQPQQRDIFTRFVTTPALDVYILGTDFQAHEDSITAIGGETEFVLTKQPVGSITSVTKNGETETTTLEKDTSSLGGSARGKDKAIFSAALTVGDIVTIKYTYNKLIEDLVAEVVGSTAGDSTLFETDILILEAVKKLITIHYSFSSFSSAERDIVNAAIVSELTTAATLETFVANLRPIDVQTVVINNVVGLSRFVIEKFQPTTGGLVEVETIFFKDNESAVLDAANLSVVGV